MASPLFGEIYAVGDSFSDSGGIFRITSELLSLVAGAGVDTQGLQPIPVSPPYSGKFSNGPVLPEITADLLGSRLINFSFGGAEALGTLSLREAAGSAIPGQVLAAIAALSPAVRAPIEAALNQNINLPRQVADLIAAASTEHPSADSALVSLIGLNDLRALAGTFDPSNPLALIGALQVAGQIVQANLALAGTAFGLGIGTVIFETLPAASFFPITGGLPPAFPAIGDLAVNSINAGLKAGALALQLQGHDVRIVDLARMADEVSADPGTYGFPSLHEPRLLGNGIQFAANPSALPIEQSAFLDPVHPTTYLHGVFGAFSALSLSFRTDFRGNGNDFIVGGSGDDFILAGAGNDQAQLGAGNDILLSGLGDDVADGGADSDAMSGGSGNDRLSGNAGSDVLAGNAGEDMLDGGPGDDALIDGPGNDTLLGGDGADLFFDDGALLRSRTEGTDSHHLSDFVYLLRAFGGSQGVHVGGGNDFMDGGGGVDTAHYSSSSSHYKLVADQSTVTVQDKVEANGLDTLVSVEQVQFTDLMLDTTWFTNAASVAASQFTDLTDMYIAYFDRAPDAVGLFYWASRLSDGMTLQEIAKSFFVQPETLATYPANQTTTEFVTQVYGNVLGRDPDQPGLNYWTNSLQTGGVSKDEFVLAIIYGARASTGSPTDVQYLANRNLVGKDYAVTEGLSNVDWATTVMADVDGTAASVQAAFTLTDSFAATAASPNSSELVVQLIGVAV